MRYRKRHAFVDHDQQEGEPGRAAEIGVLFRKGEGKWQALDANEIIADAKEVRS